MKRHSKPLKVGIVLGTRPEIIKLSPIIRQLQKHKKDYFIIHTGQHYSYEMDRLFFKQLGIPAPMHQLSERSRSGQEQGEHTGRMMAGIEEILLKKRPSVVLVQGDTNSVLAGSLVAAKMHGVKLGHVEAGLRSYDRSMPEEINRVISDRVSHYLFTPTHHSKKILLGEGVSNKNIFVTGNTIVDAVKENLRIARHKIDAAKLAPGVKGGYFLMTLHRQEHVDQKERLVLILNGLRLILREFKKPIIFPMHPRTAARLKKFGLKLPQGVEAVKPVGFLEFLILEAGAQLILTDSGGVQEEACILKVPCVTFRTSTERPETVHVGANVVSGYDPLQMLACARKMIHKKRDWKNPFGDGRAGERIVKILEESR